MNNFFWNTLILAFLTSLPFYSTAQPRPRWDRTFGGADFEELHAVTPTPDGGFILGGSTLSGVSGDLNTPSLGGWDYWVVKVDEDGNKEWDKRFGGAAEDRMWAVLYTSDGGYLLAGGSRSNMSADKSEDAIGEMDYWVIKLDNQGNKLWDKTIGGSGEDRLRAGILEAPDGGYIMAGFSNSPADGDKTEPSKGKADFWIVKIDVNGQTVEWDRTYGGIEQEQLFAFAATNDGYIMGGDSQSGIGADKTETLRGVTDWWILKIDLNGSLLWEKTLGGNLEDVMLDIQPTMDGGYIAAGKSLSPPSAEKTAAGFGLDDFWIVKMDSDGNPVWDATYGGNDTDIAHDIRQTIRGTYVVAGVSHSNVSGNRTDVLDRCKDYWMIGIDKDGTKMWDIGFGGDECDALADFDIATDGTYFIAGHSGSDAAFDKSEDSRGFNDFWVLKTDCVDPPDLLNDTTICTADLLMLDARVSPCDSCIYLWNDGSREETRVIYPEDGQVFKVTVTDDFGCVVEDSMQATILPNPIAAAFDLEMPNCYGDENGSIFIEDVISGTPPFTYSFNGNDFDLDNLFTELAPGNYDFTILDANGCTMDTTVYLEQPNQLMVDLGDEIIIELGDSVQLQAFVNQDISSLSWNDPALLSCSDCLTPYTRPSETVTFAIRVTNENGCQEGDNVRVVVQKHRALYAPNVFAPDGDENNDYFMVFPGKGVSRINTFRVFDRWGEIVYQVDDILPNQLPLGWDGRLDDRLLKPGVYGWFAEVVYFDDWVEMLKGSVTLVR